MEEQKSLAVEPCPVEAAIQIVGGKWKLLILRSLLLNGPQRYNELLTTVTAISQKELTGNLHELVGSGLLARDAGAGRTARYELTKLGAALMPTFTTLLTWGKQLLVSKVKPFRTFRFVDSRHRAVENSSRYERIHRQDIIRATPERIWALLTDAAGYIHWNNTVPNVEGKIALGERVTVRPKLNPQRAFPVKVAEFQTPYRMVWTAGMPLGLFKGERTFALTPRANSEVEFSMREQYTGLMAPLIVRSIPDLQPAFDELASDLKRAAEAN